MPQLIKKIEGELIDTITNDVNLINSINGEIQEEDYINLNGFVAFLQNYTQVETIEKLIKPLNFGLINQYNIPVIILEIDY